MWTFRKLNPYTPEDAELIETLVCADIHAYTFVCAQLYGLFWNDALFAIMGNGSPDIEQTMPKMVELLNQYS